MTMIRSQDRYDSLFQFAGFIYHVDWKLLKAQVRAESNFSPDAKSRVGARGLAQFMRNTWKEWSDGTPGIQEAPPLDLALMDPRDPEDAIMAQAAYMQWLLRLLDGDVRSALAAYNWGIGRMRRLLAEWKPPPDWLDQTPAETQTYVKRILAFYQEYKSESP